MMPANAKGSNNATPFPAHSRRKRLLCLALVAGLTGAFFLVSKVAYGKHHLGSDLSPDGALRAEYFYSSEDLISWVVDKRLNPRLHLTITDVRSGKVLDRQTESGDYAELGEARERFQHVVPWKIVGPWPE
jgi:hypothetical protein